MTTIWKFPLKSMMNCELEMPSGAKILDVQYQGFGLTLWALVNPDAGKERRTFCVFGTGFTLPDHDDLTHLATLQQDGFVWHVFEDKSNAPF